MYFKKHTVKTSNSAPRLSGYALGAGIRKSVEGKTRSIGNALNSFQHRIGIRVTWIIISLIWLAAFYYFAHLLFPLFQ
jgi:hypothetical protein